MSSSQAAAPAEPVFSLGRFESACYARQHEPAAREFVAFLAMLDRNYGGFDHGFDAKPTANMAGVDQDPHIINRICSALSALFILPAGAAAESPMLYHAMDQFWGNTPWDQRENFVWRGATVHLTQELLRSVATRQPPPKPNDVTAAIERRRAAAGLPAITDPGVQ